MNKIVALIIWIVDLDMKWTAWQTQIQSVSMSTNKKNKTLSLVTLYRPSIAVLQDRNLW